MTILNISFEEGLFAISEIIQDAPSDLKRWRFSTEAALDFTFDALSRKPA